MSARWVIGMVKNENQPEEENSECKEKAFDHGVPEQGSSLFSKAIPGALDEFESE